MKKRRAEALKDMGCTATVEQLNEALQTVKAEKFPDLSVDELIYTRDEAGEFCREVKARLNAPRLTRPFLLRSLVGIRKNPPRKKS